MNFRSLTFIFFCLLSIVMHPIFAHRSDAHEHFKISRKDWFLSTEFEIESSGKRFSRVTKDRFTLRTYYQLYDAKKGHQATGICRLFNLGLFYAWGTEIDIYDQHHNHIGLIDGQLGTLQAARFSIYDHDNLVAIAYLDLNCTGFSIVDAATEQFLIARFKRHFVRDTVDHWTADIYDPFAISPEILKIFGAFVVDSQGEFREDK